MESAIQTHKKDRCEGFASFTTVFCYFSNCLRWALQIKLMY